jgi:hypothetical protein
MMVLTVGVYHGIARVYNARRNLSNRGLLPYQAVSGLTIICISSMRIASENPPQSNFEFKDDLLFLAMLSDEVDPSFSVFTGIGRRGVDEYITISECCVSPPFAPPPLSRALRVLTACEYRVASFA